jgi:SUKH-3 immunity protein
MVEERFSKITYKVLKKAGWFPGRHVFSTIQLLHGFNLLDSARDVLDEFGGLSMQYNYSEKRGRRTHLGETRIFLDPISCGGQEDSIAEESRLIGHPLYPLGEVFDDYYDPDESTILIDDLGRVFLLSFFALYFMGETFDASLDHMIVGIKGKMVNQNGIW